MQSNSALMYSKRLPEKLDFVSGMLDDNHSKMKIYLSATQFLNSGISSSCTDDN